MLLAQKNQGIKMCIYVGRLNIAVVPNAKLIKSAKNHAKSYSNTVKIQNMIARLRINANNNVTIAIKSVK